jgi:hypothetical protein
VNHHQDVGVVRDLAAGLPSGWLPLLTIENGLHEMLENTKIAPCELHCEMLALHPCARLHGIPGISVINAIDQILEAIPYRLPLNPGEWRPTRRSLMSTTPIDGIYLQRMCARAQSATNMAHQCTHQLCLLQLLKALR